MAVLLMFVPLVNAQQRFEVHVGTSIPTGNFADNTYNNSIFGGSGCAATGLTAGAKYFYPIRSAQGLSLTLEVDLIMNGMSQSFKDQFQKEIDIAIDNSSNSYSYGSSYGSGYGTYMPVSIKVNYCNYLNIPVLGGVSYKLPINNKLAVYANGGLGCNFSKITDITMTSVYVGSFKGQSQTAKITFAPSTQLATQIGGGVLINNFSPSLNYNQLGSYQFVGKAISASGSSSPNTNSVSSLMINTYTLTLGMLF